MFGMGLNIVAKSDLTTGNRKYASYVCHSGELTFVFTAAYSKRLDQEGSAEPHPDFDHDRLNAFVAKHGLAVRAVGIRVGDARKAWEAFTSPSNGGVGVLPPQTLTDKATGTVTTMCEVQLYADTVLRFMSGDFAGPALPNYEPVPVVVENSCGLQRIDHIVSNVPHLFTAVDYLMNATGFHEFSEFTAEDVGTVDSGLNSMVLANNNEMVLLPVNEPTFGTKRKSQIQNFLEHNDGAGVQHLALKTDDIFATMDELKKRGALGGFDFMPAPGPDYYAKVPDRIGHDVLTKQQLADLQRLGLLADKDMQGVLLQVFTKPVGDRPTIFCEIIQRIGCDVDAETKKKVEQKGGCGGFGKGNFTELFKSIEDFEKQQEAAVHK
jgi:4-hydroxyphenylpyruvate dioxygenase